MLYNARSILSSSVARTNHLSRIGTYAIFRQLRQHWIKRSDPLYCADLRRHARSRYLMRGPLFPIGERLPTGDASLVIVVTTIVLMIIVAGGALAVGTPAVCGTVPILTGATWIGYVQILMASSRMIVEERERQTWDLILTLPLDRDKLLITKLAAILRTFYLDMVLWIQAVCVLALLAIVLFGVSSTARYSPPGAVISAVFLAVVTASLALITMTIGRVQDYILLSLIGSVISTLSNSRQIATATAILVGVAYLLIWLLPIVLIVPLTNRSGLSGPILITAAFTGPTGTVALGLPLVDAVITVAVFILLREVLIGALFDWLTRHLSER